MIVLVPWMGAIIMAAFVAIVLAMVTNAWSIVTIVRVSLVAIVRVVLEEITEGGIEKFGIGRCS